MTESGKLEIVGRRLEPAASAATGSRVDLAWFGIPLGLGGLGGVWAAAERLLGAPGLIADVAYGLSAALWAVLTVRHLVNTFADRQRLRSDLEHLARGPATAFIPVVGLLLSSRVATFAPHAAEILVWVFAVLLAVLDATLMRTWLLGRVGRDQIHPGFFLPMIAGAFVASIAFSSVESPAPAAASLFVGGFFWVVLGGPIVSGLMANPRLDVIRLPQLSLLLAPPATGGIAWLLLDPTQNDVIRDGFAAVIGFFVLVQILIIPAYVGAARSVNLWLFAFPLSSTVNFTMRWVAPSNVPVLQWSMVGIATVGVAAIALLSSPIGRRSPRSTLRT